MIQKATHVGTVVACVLSKFNPSVRLGFGVCSVCLEECQKRCEPCALMRGKHKRRLLVLLTFAHFAEHTLIRLITDETYYSETDEH